MSYEAIPFPTGSSNAALYSHCANLTAKLRQLLQELTDGATVDLQDLQSDVTALQADVATLQADVNAIEALLAAGDGLTPQQKFELGLVTRVDEILGSMSEVRNRQQTQFEQDADATMSAALAAYRGTTGLRTEVAVRIEETQALAQRIDSVTANLGVTDASVKTLTQAVVDGDNALATQITDVSTTVAGNSSNITLLLASVDGVYTRFGVTINAQGEVTGLIQLDGTPQGSTFTVNVDGFYVGKAGTTGGNALPVFAIQTVGGVPQIAFRGDFYADGAILAQHLAAGSVTADKINVGSLSAIAADIGTVTAGLIQNPAATLKFDLPNMRLYRTDGKADINLSTPKILFTT